MYAHSNAFRQFHLQKPPQNTTTAILALFSGFQFWSKAKNETQKNDSPFYAASGEKDVWFEQPRNSWYCTRGTWSLIHTVFFACVGGGRRGNDSHRKRTTLFLSAKCTLNGASRPRGIQRTGSPKTRSLSNVGQPRCFSPASCHIEQAHRTRQYRPVPGRSRWNHGTATKITLDSPAQRSLYYSGRCAIRMDTVARSAFTAVRFGRGLKHRRVQSAGTHSGGADSHGS